MEELARRRAEHERDFVFWTNFPSFLFDLGGGRQGELPKPHESDRGGLDFEGFSGTPCQSWVNSHLPPEVKEKEHFRISRSCVEYQRL